MATVGMKELQDHLDEYVDRSRNGEYILITDQGREVAELTPVNAARKAITALREAGKVTWSGNKPKGLSSFQRLRLQGSMPPW